MMEIKKSGRPSAGTPGRPDGSGALLASSDPASQFTTSERPGQGFRIVDFLSPGMAYAVPLRDLVALTGWPERDVRRQIEQERRAGTLIVSDNQHGYWLADDPAEAQRFARSMLGRAREIRKTARAVEAAAERMAD